MNAHGDIEATAYIVNAADRLWDAYTTLQACAPVRALPGIIDVAAAYAVQQHNTARWLGEGRRLSGRKIGLTAKTV